MSERTKIITEKGERKADGSVRFSAHSAGNPMAGVMEMIHNLVTYGKSKGKVIIEPCGGNMCNYRFYNNSDIEMLPTFEKLKTIAETAGKSISSNEGVSLCGVGTEVMGLSSRPYADSTVTCQINVVRDGKTYGIILTFKGISKEILYEIIPPKESDAENSYDVIFKGCKMLSTSEIGDLKRKIVDTMPDNGLEIIFLTDEERCVLTHQDFLYRKELVGTNNYEKVTFKLENGESLILEMSDVSDIIKSGKGNEYEDNCQCSPSLSGGVFRYKGIATICRDNIGWKFSGAYASNHPTRNNIRFDISGGEYVFRELHKESQVKTETVISMKDIKGEYRDTLKIYDENGEEYDISEISTYIKQFCSKHKTDSNSDKNIRDTITSLSDGVLCGEITKNDIKSATKVLGYVCGRMYTGTLVEQVLEVI